MNDAPICNICKRPKEFHSAGINKQGKAYDAFWGCPDWKDTIHKNAKERWQKASKTSPDAPQTPTTHSPQEVGWNIIADEIKALRDADKEMTKRLDRASELYVKMDLRIKKLEQ